MRLLADSIATHPFLRGMDARHLEILAACGMQTQFAPDQVILREGDLANRFYLLVEGKVALQARSTDGHLALVHTLTGGDVLGWSWMFAPFYWHFDAQALEPTTAVFFYGTRLRAECEEDHDFGYELVKRTAAAAIQRLEKTRAQLLQGHPPA
jgi:CRP/FNR family cyclic AMP-dependent transcriptional regulator